VRLSAVASSPAGRDQRGSGSTWPPRRSRAWHRARPPHGPESSPTVLPWRADGRRPGIWPKHAGRRVGRHVCRCLRPTRTRHPQGGGARKSL